jgi:hypothetical protein
MSDERIRKLERRFGETGGSDDEIAYLFEAHRSDELDSERYSRVRELVADNSIQIDDKESIIEIVRQHDHWNPFETLTDEEIVNAMPLVNYFLDKGHSIYSTKNSEENDSRSFPELVFRGKFGISFFNEEEFSSGDCDLVIEDLEKSLGANNASYLRPSVVGHNNKSVEHRKMVYETMTTIVEYRGNRFKIEFLDDQVIDFRNQGYIREEIFNTNDELDEFYPMNDSQVIPPLGFMDDDEEKEDDGVNIGEDFFF